LQNLTTRSKILFSVIPRHSASCNFRRR